MVFKKGNTFGFKKGNIPFNFKGENVGYVALHDWIRVHYGKANKCENKDCKFKNPKKYSWANISGEYRRDIKDWMQLCYSCHKKMDFKPKMFCKNSHKLEGENLWINNRGNRVCKICKKSNAHKDYLKHKEHILKRVKKWRENKKN